MRVKLSYLLFFFISPWIVAEKEELDCPVTIIGGGPGGLHTAYRLATAAPNKEDRAVCLFEKNDYLGGRALDIALDPEHPELVYGVGALRVMENQAYVLKLADELGIGLERVAYRDNLINARGHFSFSGDELLKNAYPELPHTFIDNSGEGSTSYYWKKLLHSPETNDAWRYPSFVDFAQSILSKEAFLFLHDMSRFKEDYFYGFNALAYVEYLLHDEQNCCVPSYPIGGMSAFVQEMAKRASLAGARIFKSEPVLSINKNGDGRYVVETPSYRVRSDKVVIAADKIGVEKIEGTIAHEIKKAPEFQSLSPVKVVTITQRWPTKWWRNPGFPSISRAWTADHCLRFLEIPVNHYAEDQQVTRSVYTDDLACANFWEELFQKEGTAGVEREIQLGLTYLFPNQEIPQSLATYVKVWPGAWYPVASTASPTMCAHDVANWAVEPLGEHEKVYLVGESYNPEQSAWATAAYNSSIRVLNQHFGLSSESEP